MPDAPTVGFKVPRLTEQIDAPAMSDAGMHERITAIYQSQPILFLIRDAVDTIASMAALELGADGSWLTRWVPPILSGKFADPRFAHDFDDDRARLPFSAYPDLTAAALYWKYKTLAYYRYLAAGYPIYPVLYERLTTEPRFTLERILRFLGVEWHDAVLAHHLLEHDEISPDGSTVGGTDPTRAIDAKSVGAGRRRFSKGQIEAIRAITAPLDDLFQQTHGREAFFEEHPVRRLADGHFSENSEG